MKADMSIISYVHVQYVTRSHCLSMETSTGHTYVITWSDSEATIAVNSRKSEVCQHLS